MLGVSNGQSVTVHTEPDWMACSSSFLAETSKPPLSGPDASGVQLHADGYLCCQSCVCYNCLLPLEGAQNSNRTAQEMLQPFHGLLVTQRRHAQS